MPLQKPAINIDLDKMQLGISPSAEYTSLFVWIDSDAGNAWTNTRLPGDTTTVYLSRLRRNFKIPLKPGKYKVTVQAESKRPPAPTETSDGALEFELTAEQIERIKDTEFLRVIQLTDAIGRDVHDLCGPDGSLDQLASRVEELEKLKGQLAELQEHVGKLPTCETFDALTGKVNSFNTLIENRLNEFGAKQAEALGQAESRLRDQLSKVSTENARALERAIDPIGKQLKAINESLEQQKGHKHDDLAKPAMDPEIEQLLKELQAERSKQPKPTAPPQPAPAVNPPAPVPTSAPAPTPSPAPVQQPPATPLAPFRSERDEDDRPRRRGYKSEARFARTIVGAFILTVLAILIGYCIHGNFLVLNARSAEPAPAPAAIIPTQPVPAPAALPLIIPPAGATNAPATNTVATKAETDAAKAAAIAAIDKAQKAQIDAENLKRQNANLQASLDDATRRPTATIGGNNNGVVVVGDNNQLLYASQLMVPPLCNGGRITVIQQPAAGCPPGYMQFQTQRGPACQRQVEQPIDLRGVYWHATPFAGEVNYPASWANPNWSGYMTLGPLTAPYQYDTSYQ